MTPIHVSQGGDGMQSLKVPPQDRLKPLSRDASNAPSPAQLSGNEDTPMGDSGAPSRDVQAEDSDGIDEGEDLEEGEHEGETSPDKMDES